MGELREIVDLNAVNRVFALAAYLAPICGLLLGALVGSRRGALRQGVRSGLVIGMAGPLNWLLWRVYNLLTDRNGLDTVRNLLINLTLFITLGALFGAAAGLLRRRAATDENAGDTSAQSMSVDEKE